LVLKVFCDPLHILIYNYIFCKLHDFFHLNLLSMKHIYLILALISLSNFATGQHSDWIVKFDKKPSEYTLKNKSTIVSSIEVLSPTLNVYNIKTVSEVDEDILQKQFSNIESISHNAKLENRSVTPNDDLFRDQWSLNLINADRVWEETTGGVSIDGYPVVIAILDDGYDINHEDLIQNYWINNEEIPNDNIDNDNNGFIDDVKGVNIQTNTGTHSTVLHGTQVAGIIGAKGNNGIGVSGVNWNTKILPVSGVSNIGEIIKGLEYLYNLKKKFIESNGRDGANIVVNNFSGGIRFRFPSDFPSWCEQYDLLGSVGILSVGAVANADFDVEIEGDLPTLCESDYLIMVTNTNEADVKVLDAAFGSKSVDLAAPGERIISTGIGGQYDDISGTSASAPHVAGSIGLLYTIPCEGIPVAIENNPSAFALSVKNAILNGVDKLPSLENTVSKGRLNVFNSVFELNENCGEAGIEELQISSVYPNLIHNSHKSFTIKIDYKTDVFGIHDVYIHNMKGQLVHKESFNPNIFGSRTLELLLNRQMDAGVYALSIVESDRVASSKFVVVR